MIKLTEEQQIIQDSVARYLEESCSFDQRQRYIELPDGFDHGQWRDFAELGWLGIPFAESCGGYGGSLIEAAIICEQLGRSLHRSPYLSTVVGACTVLLAAGSEAQKTQYLPGIAEGRLIVSCAFDEKTQQTHQLREDPCHAKKTSVGYEITGTKALVPYAAPADHFIVSALLNDQLRLFVVPADSPRLHITAYKMYDGSRTGDVDLSAATVGADSLFDGDAAGTISLMADCETAVLCVEAASIMSSVQEQTLEYLKTREQFGQRLSGFQALQHRAVDMYVYCQLAQSMAWDAVAAVVSQSSPRARSRRVSAAKSYIGETGRIVGKEGIQLHGGIAMTDALPIGHYLKRLTAIDHLHGDSGVHRERFISADDFFTDQSVGAVQDDAATS